MMAQAIDGVLVDLRNNGGGSLPEAVEMTGLFITAGPVVEVKERRGVQVLSHADPIILYKGPVVVLVNRQAHLRPRFSPRRSRTTAARSSSATARPMEKEPSSR